MPVRSVLLTDRQAALADKLVSMDRFENASDALRLVETNEAEDKRRLHVLREAVRRGAADADAGRITWLDSRAKLRRHLAALTDAARHVPAAPASKASPVKSR